MKPILFVLAVLSASAATAAAPRLYSEHAVVFEVSTGRALLEKNADQPAPIASATKVLTAMVALDARPDLKERLTVGDQDVDRLKFSSSRLPVGSTLSREDMLHIALMASENRAASALARSYPGGTDAFVAEMNKKAKQLGMSDTVMRDPTGLNPGNRASARDLTRMVLAAEGYVPITTFTTSTSYLMQRGREFHNTNRFVGAPNWNVELSKTGYIREAGRCIVLRMRAAGKDLVVVLLGAETSQQRTADLVAIKKWVRGKA